MAIADWLAKSDNVGNNIVIGMLESPHVTSNSTESDLNFVRNAHTASLTNVPSIWGIRLVSHWHGPGDAGYLLVHIFEVVLGRNDLTTTANHRLAYKCSDASSVVSCIHYHALHFIGIALPDFVVSIVFTGVFTTIAAWQWGLKYGDIVGLSLWVINFEHLLHGPSPSSCGP